MPANLTWATGDSGNLEHPDSWDLPNLAVRDFTDAQNADDADRPWAPWGRLTGISSANNRDVTHAVARRIQQGAHWLAPANSLFTRSDLDLAVRNIAGVSNVWLDVFCIPQDDDVPEKAIEIGKQSSIFRSAGRAVVWLGTGGEHALAEVCSWVPETIEMVPVKVFSFPSEWMIRERGRPEQRDEETWRRMKMVSEFTRHVPWASSLWTLQESALRPDAVFHGKLGEPLLSKNTGVPITIKHLRTTMRRIREELLDFIDTIHGWDNFSPLERPDLWGPSEKDGWYLSSSDISLVFQALDTVNTVSVHNLGTMNAGELLLASKQRTASAPQDRAYGIMGAIGVTLKVDYRLHPDHVFDDLLLELHNQVPVEIQAFYRPQLFRPLRREWMIDEDAKALTLLRQKEMPETPPFVEITPEGWLVAAQIEPILAGGLAHLTGRILSNRALVAADKAAFRALSPVMQHKGAADGGSTTLSAHLSHILRLISCKTQLALVYLGTVSGIEQMGWRTAYLLLARLTPAEELSASSMGVDTSQHFQRLGMVIAMEKFAFNEVMRGRFIIRKVYHQAPVDDVNTASPRDLVRILL
ncbi:hypothetical protein diail_5260 [Diaporthe ilicicola]|nr:hypothetical protein diail_5260 [Diaporthe ilicicola]